MNVFDDEQYDSLHRKIIANARAIITFEVGLPLGCVKMSRLFTWIKPRETFNYPVFDSYLEAVKDLAIGQDRLEWNRQSLARQDEKLETVNSKYRKDIMDACFDLLKELKSR